MDDDEMLSRVTGSELLEFRASQFSPAFIVANPGLFLNLDWIHPVPLREFLLNRDAGQPPVPIRLEPHIKTEDFGAQIGDFSSPQRPSTSSAGTTGQMVEDHPDIIDISSSDDPMEETVSSDSCLPPDESECTGILTDGQDELARYFARGCIAHAKRALHGLNRP